MTDPLTAPAVAPYPADPADLFVVLYDELPDSLFRGWRVMEWYGSDDVQDLATKISEAVLEYGELAPEDAGRIIARDGHRGRFTILLGLDIALAHVNPYGPYHEAAGLSWLGYRAQYERGHLLNNPDETAGALLPRCAYPGRPIGLRRKDEFFGVHRIPPEQWNSIDYRVLEPARDAYVNRDRPVTVACAPILETYDDVRVDFEEHHGLTVYRLGPRDSGALRERIRRVLERLDASGATLAVMPEATLDDGLLEHWKDLVWQTAGRESSLRYLLLGSGPVGGGDPPANRAVFLDRWTGEEILVQDKMACFIMDERQMRFWRVPGPPSGGPAEEYITPGSTIGLVDADLGRLAVLICEDLTRSIDWERELRACGVSHLLVPIFSKPILEHRWEHQAADREVTLLGSWVVVSNSRAVGNEIPAEQLKGRRFTCLIAGPDDLRRTTYDIGVQLGAAATAGELGLVEVSEDGHTRHELPRVLPGAVQDMWHDHWPTPGSG
ncbi:hypothetical protein [Spirillospora sp. NPDC047279]|uniref:hypothetical protein n=1 Tax=Spirillospora sp. NPDC047279 TaxID=3155478 RepID=UPI0033D9B2CE